ncbi:MAG: hypothetical protein PVI30_01500 [Myxococcales bacterium]|jgi:hypothetical protein
MNRAVAERLTWVIAGLGLVTTLGMIPLWGVAAARSTLVGAVLGVANWVALRYIVARVVGGSVQRQAGFMFVLMLKMGALAALCFLLIRAQVVSPLPFLIGLSTLVVGAIGGSLVQILNAPEQSERHDAAR